VLIGKSEKNSFFGKNQFFFRFSDLPKLQKKSFFVAPTVARRSVYITDHHGTFFFGTKVDCCLNCDRKSRFGETVKDGFFCEKIDSASEPINFFRF
jgi:hypothetical protein